MVLPSLLGVEEVAEKRESGVGGCDGSEKDSEGKSIVLFTFRLIRQLIKRD